MTEAQSVRTARPIQLAAALVAAALACCNEVIGAEAPEVVPPEAEQDVDGQPTTAGNTAAGFCGDGERADAEQCDDGNTETGDACTPDCRVVCAMLDLGPTPSGACYRLLEVSSTFDDATAHCEEIGGTLATFASPDDLVPVQNHLLQDVWIGARDPVGDGSFEWVTGEPWGFESWLKSEPTANGCAFIDGELLGWRAAPCDTTMSFVCELSP